MLASSRRGLHQYLHAECASCGFAVEGEIRNGCGGWKSLSWSDFSRQCHYRTRAGQPTFVCPHLRAAKIGSRPVTRTGDTPGERVFRVQGGALTAESISS